MGRTLVIAEAGSCHDGNFIKALALVVAAQEAGADAVKFQFWSDANRLADRRRVPEHYRAIYRRYQMRPSWLPNLARTSEAAGIEFMCSTYLPEDVATVAPFVNRFKVASFEADSEELVLAHLPFLTQGRELLVSIGMDPALEWEGELPLGTDLPIRLLQCVSSYPAPIAATHLDLIREHELAGLSDHSRDVRMGSFAVCAGASVVEAHLRLNDTDPENPDYETAFTPREFAVYVANIRAAEQAMGEGYMKQLQDCEREMSAYRVTSS